MEEKIETLISETIEKLGYELYDVIYEKEAKDFYLRIFIDTPNGISLDDCEKVNDAINPILDEANYIKDQYFLEVSSPGVERRLRKNKHFEASISKEVDINLYSPITLKQDEINEKSRENSRRDSNEQTKAKLFNDESGFVDTPKKLKDQGGHACPASAGGLKEMINIFPQAFIINNGKEWKDQENKMRRLYKTEEPFVVETIREYNGKSRRPTLIRRSVNDESFTFNNLNSERLKFFSCQQH